MKQVDLKIELIGNVRVIDNLQLYGFNLDNIIQGNML